MTTMKQSQLYAALAAAGAFNVRGRLLADILSNAFGGPPNILPRRHRSTNKFTPHQGAREIGRRFAQMARDDERRHQRCESAAQRR